MTKWIRWKGLIAFLVVTGLISIFWFLLVDIYVERAIEKTGTAIVGAKVELDSADLSLFPLGLKLNRLQVTNPDEPFRNTVEAQKLSFRINSLNLLRRKIIIEEMAAEGIQLDTPRKTSGALKKEKPKEASRESKASLFSGNLPNVKDVFEKEKNNLESIKLADALKEEIKSFNDTWKKKLSELPGKEKIEAYKKRISELRSKEKGVTGILGSTSEVLSLKKEIEADIKLLNDAQAQYSSKLASLNKQMDSVLKAPENDLKRIKEKYRLTSTGLGNYSQILFGEQIGKWVKQIIYWHRKIGPLLGRTKAAKDKPSVSKPIRAKGVDVHFVEYNPLPDFLIRLVNASVALKAGGLSGKIMNITTDQGTLGLPLTFAFAGEKFKDFDSVKFEGSLNHINPAQSKDTINLEMSNYKIADYSITSSGMPIKINNAAASIAIDSTIAGEKINANISGKLRGLNLSVSKEGESSQMQKIFASTIQGIKELNFTVKVTGDVDNYSVDISSDVENILKKALQDQIGKLTESWDKEFLSAIKDKTGAQLPALKTDLAGLNASDSGLKSRSADMSSLLKELVSPAAGKTNFKLPF